MAKAGPVTSGRPPSRARALSPATVGSSLMQARVLRQWWSSSKFVMLESHMFSFMDGLEPVEPLLFCCSAHCTARFFVRILDANQLAQLLFNRNLPSGLLFLTLCSILMSSTANF